MSDFEMLVTETGDLEALWSDDVVSWLEEVGSVRSVERLSNVEWEGAGWTVRSAADPELALRRSGGVIGCPPKLALIASRDVAYPLASWPRRRDALAAEVENAWALRAPAEGGGR